MSQDQGEDTQNKINKYESEGNDGSANVLNRTAKIYNEHSRFSHCIYEEMQIDEIKREYVKTVNEKEQYEEALKSGTLEENEDVHYIIKRFNENLDIMRGLCDKWLHQERIQNPSNDPEEGFDLLFHARKHDPRHRLTGMYCYDVRESETFKNTFKAEFKMREI